MTAVPYLIVFFILFLLSFPQHSMQTVGNINVYENSKRNSFYAFFIVYIIVLFIGGRWYVGPDCINYEKAFEIAPSIFELNSLSWEEFIKKCGMEKGFCYWMILFKSFINNYWAFSFFNAIIDYTLFYICLNDYLSKYKGIALLFFYVFIADSHLGINMVRNIKSVMFFLYSLRFIYDKKVLKYFAINLFGCLFHISSLFYIPMYFLLNKKYNKKLFIVIYAFGIIIFMMNIKWVSFLLQPFANSNFGRISYLVLEYSDKGNAMSVSGKITIGFLERFISFILLMVYKERIERKFKYGVIFVNMAFIYFILFFFFNEMYIFVQRLPPLFLLSYCFIFPMIYSFLTKNQKGYFFVCIFLYMVLRVLKGNSGEHYLYTNIFSPIKPDRFQRIQQIISAESKVI